MSLQETIKQLREQNGKRPCDCEYCDCGNSGDTYSVGSWDGTAWALNEIERALSHPAPEPHAMKNFRPIDEYVAELEQDPVMKAALDKARAELRASPAPDTVRVPVETFAKLVEVHRGWCNFCKGNEEWCMDAPSGGCSLRDCIAQSAKQRGGG